MLFKAAGRHPILGMAAAFAGGQFDCVGVFAPFTTQALGREGAHVLFSSKDHPGSISDHFVATAARADATADCEAKAIDKNGKKLAGAARTSFVKKCERESGGANAGAACEAKAAEKKLAGAAKNSFVKKCVADAAK